MQIDVENGTLYYETYGEGETIIFLNGFASGISNWYPIIRRLRRTRRCVVFDYVGTGQSRCSEPGVFSMDGYCRELNALMDVLRVRRVHLVGYSMGGWIAQEFASRQPDAMITLSLVNTSAKISTHQRYIISHLIDVLKIAEIPVFSRLMMVSYYSPGYFEKNADQMERLEQLVSLALSEHKPETWRNILESCLPFNVSERLSSFSFPLLLVSGQHDFLCPRPTAEAYSGKIAALKWIELPDVGHAIPMERWNELESALFEFVDTRQS